MKVDEVYIIKMLRVMKFIIRYENWWCSFYNDDENGEYDMMFLFMFMFMVVFIIREYGDEMVRIFTSYHFIMFLIMLWCFAY